MKTLGALLTVSIFQIMVTPLCIPPTSTSSITTIDPSTKSNLSPRQPIPLTTPSRQNLPLSYELKTRDEIYRQCPGKEPTDAEEASENDENDSIPKRLMRRCEMGRKKGYYELHPERATDHLYDIKVDSAVGKEVAEKQFGPLMERIHKTVDPK
jgi:hypothetical protein